MQETEFKSLARFNRPPQIEDLWRLRITDGTEKGWVHIRSEHLDWWTTEEEISELLDDEERLRQIDLDFANKSLQIGMFGKDRSEQLARFNSIFVNPECLGCNNPYDSGGCQHPGSPKTVPMFDPQINQIAHDTLTMLSVITYLVAYEYSNKNTNKLALLLAPTRNAGYSHNPLLNFGLPVTTITLVLGLMDNCSRSFPKIAHKAAGLLSLLICQSPAAAFSNIDGKAFLNSMWNYMKEIFRLVHNSECLVEEHYGIVAFLNILPALYHFGNWNEVKSSTLFNAFCGFFVSVTINICHGAISTEDPNPDDPHLIDDPPKDLNNLPELLGAQVLMEALLMVKESDTEHDTVPRDWRIQFMHARPRTFAVMAALETLGWWMSQGIDLSLPDISWKNSSSRKIKSVILEYRPRIRLLIQESPRPLESSKYLEPIMDALIAGGNRTPSMKIRKPTVSLLYGPFIHDNRRCGQCQKTADDVGHDLLRCQGGCGGLQHYCSREHQKLHWHEHKFFCKLNASYSQYTGN